jgi:hypothetical protein
MNLINNVYAVSTNLRWYPYLVVQASDIFNFIVGGCIKLMNIKRPERIKRDT